MRPLSEKRLLAERVADAREPRRSSSVGLNSSVPQVRDESSIAALRSAVSRRSPSGAAKTTLSTPPCSVANSDSIRSVARCVSDPGISNSSRRPPPTVATSTISATTIPSQPRSTRHGCVAHARIHPASAPVASRSWAASLPFPCSLSSVPTSTSDHALRVLTPQTDSGGGTHRCTRFAPTASSHSRASSRIEGAVARTPSRRLRMLLRCRRRGCAAVGCSAGVGLNAYTGAPSIGSWTCSRPALSRRRSS